MKDNNDILTAAQIDAALKEGERERDAILGTSKSPAFKYDINPARVSCCGSIVVDPLPPEEPYGCSRVTGSDLHTPHDAAVRIKKERSLLDGPIHLTPPPLTEETGLKILEALERIEKKLG